MESSKKIYSSQLLEMCYVGMIFLFYIQTKDDIILHAYGGFILGSKIKETLRRSNHTNDQELKIRHEGLILGFGFIICRNDVVPN